MSADKPVPTPGETACDTGIDQHKLSDYVGSRPPCQPISPQGSEPRTTEPDGKGKVNPQTNADQSIINHADAFAQLASKHWFWQYPDRPYEDAKRAATNDVYPLIDATKETVLGLDEPERARGALRLLRSFDTQNPDVLKAQVKDLETMGIAKATAFDSNQVPTEIGFMAFGDGNLIDKPVMVNLKDQTVSGVPKSKLEGPASIDGVDSDRIKAAAGRILTEADAAAADPRNDRAMAVLANDLRRTVEPGTGNYLSHFKADLPLWHGGEDKRIAALEQAITEKGGRLSIGDWHFGGAYGDTLLWNFRDVTTTTPSGQSVKMNERLMNKVGTHLWEGSFVRPNE